LKMKVDPRGFYFGGGHIVFDNSKKKGN